MLVLVLVLVLVPVLGVLGRVRCLEVLVELGLVLVWLLVRALVLVLEISTLMVRKVTSSLTLGTEPIQPHPHSTDDKETMKKAVTLPQSLVHLTQHLEPPPVSPSLLGANPYATPPRVANPQNSSSGPASSPHGAGSSAVGCSRTTGIPLSKLFRKAYGL